MTQAPQQNRILLSIVKYIWVNLSKVNASANMNCTMGMDSNDLEILQIGSAHSQPKRDG